MNYLTFPLGDQTSGAVAVVSLSGVESDVFLVDAPNLSSFEHGGSFHYTGGHYSQSPVRLAVPSAGQWTVVVIPAGGQVEASVRLVA